MTIDNILVYFSLDSNKFEIADAGYVNLGPEFNYLPLQTVQGKQYPRLTNDKLIFRAWKRYADACKYGTFAEGAQTIPR